MSLSCKVIQHTSVQHKPTAMSLIYIQVGEVRSLPVVIQQEHGILSCLLWSLLQNCSSTSATLTWFNKLIQRRVKLPSVQKKKKPGLVIYIIKVSESDLCCLITTDYVLSQQSEIRQAQRRNLRISETCHQRGSD